MGLAERLFMALMRRNTAVNRWKKWSVRVVRFMKQFYPEDKTSVDSSSSYKPLFSIEGTIGEDVLKESTESSLRIPEMNLENPGVGNDFIS